MTSAVATVRRGLAVSPELRNGIGWTAALALIGGAGRIAVPVLVQQVLDRGLTKGSIHLSIVYMLAAFAVLSVVITATATRATQRRLAVASENALCALRVRAFSHVHRISTTDARRGALVSRVTSDVDTLGIFLQWGGVAWVVNGAIMIAALLAMAAYDVRLTFVVIAVSVPLALLLRMLQGRLGAAHDMVRARVGELLALVSESVQGSGVIRAFGIEQYVNDRCERAIHRWREAKIRAGLLGSFVFTSGEFFSFLTIAGVLAVAVAIGPLGGLTAGGVVAFVLLVNFFLEPVTELTEVIDQTQTAVAGWGKVLDLLDVPVAVRPPVHGRALSDRAPALTVERVSFAYQPGDLVLNDVSFTVPAGSRVAIVGATGSGKTTLVTLLARLADPCGGRILVDGVDLRDVDEDDLRRRLLVVPQEPFLFNTTVGENVAFARQDATDLHDTFDQLGLRDWLGSLPAGLDTPVGQRGEHLSMGERQFVALARAYLADPAVLLLDEATAAVDPASDVRLTRAMERLSAGRTLLIVAHRLATAERADEVLVLCEGRLAEQGTHEELVARKGAYAQLHASWLDVTSAAPGR